MARLIVAATGILFIIICILAYGQVGWSGFDRVLAEPWGMVTFLDVMLGAVCMSAVILSQEADKRVAVLWAAPIFMLGHVVSAAWLVFRYLPKKIG